MLKRLITATAVFALIAFAAVYWLFWARPGPASGPSRIVVEEGTSLYRLADTLAERGLVPGSARTYRVMARIFGSSDPIQAGEFAIPARTSGSGVLDILQHGRPVVRLITIPEGMPSILVYEKLMTAKDLAGNVIVPPEGSVLPDSYAYQLGESRAAVLDRMQKAMDRELERLWPTRTARSIVRDKREAVILASIVEKETGKPSERAMVAGVYTNRLQRGMKLDADPTVIYPVTKGKRLGRRILRSELASNNGYNTYAMTGLPIGPIANPGRDSIAAVLAPAQTDALYFVADGTGGHLFASTLGEHEANRQRWYAIRRARGEM
jgi:UPF0755 protein